MVAQNFGIVLTALLMLGLVTACAGDPDEVAIEKDADDILLLKNDARDRARNKADDTDFCKQNDWYSDGTCDDFCTDPDPDCRGQRPPAWFATEDVSACVIIELGCCDHCNGGEVIAVNRAYVRHATAALVEDACDAACTERGCDAAVATVVDGSCAIAP